MVSHIHFLFRQRKSLYIKCVIAILLLVSCVLFGRKILVPYPIRSFRSHEDIYKKYVADVLSGVVPRDPFSGGYVVAATLREQQVIDVQPEGDSVVIVFSGGGPLTDIQDLVFSISGQFKPQSTKYVHTEPLGSNWFYRERKE